MIVKDHLTMNLQLLIIVSLVAVGWAATIVPTQPGCVHDGKNYQLGSKFGTQCSPCECMKDGHVSCLVIDCFFVPCVDSVQDPTKCCPTCPNGENCQYKNGTIIKKGDVFHPDAHTTCKCPEVNFGFGMSPNAVCIST